MINEFDRLLNEFETKGYECTIVEKWCDYGPIVKELYILDGEESILICTENYKK